MPRLALYAWPTMRAVPSTYARQARSWAVWASTAPRTAMGGLPCGLQLQVDARVTGRNAALDDGEAGPNPVHCYANLAFGSRQINAEGGPGQ